MSEYLTVWRIKVDDSNVERLVRDQPKAVAFTKSISPELLSAELIKLEDGRWLHMLRWSSQDGLAKLGERLAENPEEAAEAGALHPYVAEDEAIGHGEVVTHA